MNGFSPETPLWESRDPTIEITFSGKRASHSLEKACGGRTSTFERLKSLIPSRFNQSGRHDFHEAILTGVIAMISSAGLLQINDITVMTVGATVVLTTPLAVVLVRFLFFQLTFLFEESFENAQLLHQELCRKFGKLLTGVEHNMPRFSNITSSFILTKTLYNRQVCDRENCLDNVIQDRFRLGDREFESREETVTSTKFNFYSFEDVVAYLGRDAVREFESGVGGVAHIPLWSLEGETDDFFGDAFYSVYGDFPPSLSVPKGEEVMCRLMSVKKVIYKGKEVTIAFVMIRDETIPELGAKWIYITEKMSAYACLVPVPARLLLFPTIPVSIRQSYKKKGRATFNVVVSSRPTIFRDNDGRIADGSVTNVRRAWRGNYYKSLETSFCASV